MTKHDYRAMCAELVDAIFTPNPYNWEDSLYEAANRARALLAHPTTQPVAEEPTIPSSTLHRQELTPSEVTLLNTFWRSR